MNLYVAELLEYGTVKIITFRKMLMAGFELGTPHKVYYNPWILHSLPIAITTYANFLVRNGTNIKDIQIKNHPIPTIKVEKFIPSFNIIYHTLFLNNIMYVR